MKVLLIYPEYPATFWNFKYALRFIAKKAAYPPLGLLTVAAMLPEQWDQQLIDMNVTPLRHDDLRQADLVFISAMSIQADSAREVIARCRQAGVTVVAGGPLFTTTPEEFTEVDHLVLNEAEVTLPAFLTDFARGRARHCYTSTELPDLRETPGPRWELINMAHYASMSIQLTRGCPYDCEFCNITTLFGHAPRTKDAGQILAELTRLYTLGWRGGVFFVDDNFIGHRKKVKEEILPAIIAWMEAHRHPFTFISQTSINLASDDELMALMTRAGFASVFVGIESPNEESLVECNKIPNKHRDLIADVKTIQRAGLQVQGGFIVGFDSDPISIFDRLIGFIQDSGIVTAMVGLLNAMQGTRLYRRLQAEGRLLASSNGNNTDYSLNFRPVMNPQVLQQGYQAVIDALYAPDAYYRRMKHFLRDFRPANPRRWRITPAHVLAAVKMSVVLGVVEAERRYYWRLLFWSLARRPRLLPLALVYTAYGYHIRKCFEQHLAAESV